MPVLAPDVSALLSDLGERFLSAGYEVALVGGPVRDVLLGRDKRGDLDLTTSAQPSDILRLLEGWADTVWDVGIRFGTVGCRKGDHILEITTYRSEEYDPDSRKPEVTFGSSLIGDLGRRDFTVNSMALRLPEMEFVDPFGGVNDLAARVLRTPCLLYTSPSPRDS